MAGLATIVRGLEAARIQLTRPQPGQTNVEYALILFMVALATVLVLTAFAGNTNSMLSSVNTSLGS